MTGMGKYRRKHMHIICTNNNKNRDIGFEFMQEDTREEVGG